jgi:hypothetical protein
MYSGKIAVPPGGGGLETYIIHQGGEVHDYSQSAKIMLGLHLTLIV